LEQEILEIRGDVSWPALYGDRVAGARQDRPGCRLRVERGAALIEDGGKKIGAVPHASCVRRDRARQDTEQRRFADAVAADEPETVATQDARREIARDDDRA